MLIPTKDLLLAAQAGGYAIGAFNVYNLEGVKAVIGAAEAERSPVILQIHPKALVYGGSGLAALCLAAAQETAVPALLLLPFKEHKCVCSKALELFDKHT